MSITYLDRLLDVARQFKLDTDGFVDVALEAQLARNDFNARVPADYVARLAVKIAKQSGRADLGVFYGLSVKPSIHGSLGQALISSATLRDAIQLVARYQSNYVNSTYQSLAIVDDEVVITVRERSDLANTRRVFLEAFLVSSCECAFLLLGRKVPGFKVCVDWSEPDYFGSYKNVLDYWHFDYPEVQIRFPAKYLALPFIMHDPTSQKYALAQIARYCTIEGASESDTFAEKVRCVLLAGESGFPSLPAVARAFHVSERTLKRRLEGAGTSFQRLLEGEKKRYAMHMLEIGGLSVQDIGHRLGYTDASAFSRAFKRWCGKTPSEYSQKEIEQ